MSEAIVVAIQLVSFVVIIIIMAVMANTMANVFKGEDW